MSRYLGQLIQDRRGELRLSYQDIGDAIGFHKSYVEVLAKGRRKSPIEPETRVKLARVLKVPVTLVEEAVRKDAALGGYDISVSRTGRKATVIARIDELPDDDLKLEMIEKMLEAGMDQARRRNTR